jgi:acetyl esterase/lipase
MARIDPQMQEVLDAFEELGPKPIEELDPKEARQQPTPADAVGRVLAARGESTEPEAVGDVEEIDAGNPVRVYTPVGADGPLPVLLYFHGGGFVIADLDVYDSSPRALANAAQCVVVSAEYRKGPEDPYPAAHDDAFAAYRWVLENMETLNGDGRVAIAGESAGGNLAASTALQAREAGLPLPIHQLLVYPIADGDSSKPAYDEYADAKPLNTPMMEWFTQHYAPDAADPRFALTKADLSGLPPATIITAEIDPLRDDGPALAARLEQAGVPVEQRKFDGVTHEFFGMGAAVDKAQDAVDFAAERLVQAFAQAGVAAR